MARWKEPPNVIVRESTTMPPENLEGLKRLIKKVAFRKMKQMEGTPDRLYEPA